MRRARRLVWATLFLLVLILLSVVRVNAQGAGDPVVIDDGAIPALPDFLGFIASPPGAVVVGAVLSMYLARWGWYNQQDGEIKKLVAYGLTVVVAAVAWALVTYVPAGFWAQAEEMWVIVVFCAFAVAGNQGWFQVAIKRARGEPAELPRRQWSVIGDEDDGEIS